MGYGNGSIAATGIGFTVLGMQLSLSLVAAIVVTLIVGGGLIYRYANRKKRYAQ